MTTIVVGAGILGLSVAVHLLRQGNDRVVVVDAANPADATTGAGAGFVGLWAAGYADFFTATDLALEQYGIDFYRQLAEGADIGCRTNGNLYLATDDDGWRRWIAPIPDHPFAPPETRTLDAADVTRVTDGAVATGAVVGGVLHPGGIQISAGRATRAMAAQARALGAELRPHTRVTGLLTSDGAVTGIRTEHGDLPADQVVLASGAWTNDLLAEVGYRVPLLRIVASRVVSPRSGVSARLPTIMVPDHFGLWVREHRGGLTYGNGDGYAPLSDLSGRAQPTGRRPVFPELIDRLGTKLVPRLRKLLPDADISAGYWLQGIPCMTPDRRFLAGPVPGAPGLSVLAGDNEAGVTHGPGLGRVVAGLLTGTEWVDPGSYRLERFDPAEFPTEQAIQAAMPARR
ncbi:NAD(P)/FAD-dependent oxidoreductase [Amycolatopsis jejuensis]|uniref:NAD(P)/FAD-dependent oxidoreductase n=1 Tax=Amycolatopsis jejuensis TaxID=330084 RepID=UPI0005251955|nr:FAD-binding oxidoreductase [Amycolatopsis jejuensis]